MTPGLYNIEAKQSDWSLSVNWLQGASAPDLAAFTARLIVRYSPNSNAVVLECSTADGRITLGGVPFNVVIDVAKRDMLAVPPGRYVYDLELQNSAGAVFALLTGRFVVQPSTVYPA
jgi:hypothetical protein